MSATRNSLRDLLRSTDSGPEKLSDGRRRGKPASAKKKGPASLKLKAGNKDLLDALFDRITPFYLADSSGNVIICSKKFREIAPYLFSGNGDPVTLDETPIELANLIDELASGSEDIRRSDPFRIGDQDHHFISEHFVIRDAEEQVIGFGGIYEDVSPLARATQKAGEMESWLRDVMRSSSDWLWSTDDKFNLSFISPRISEVIDTPAQALKGHHLFALGEFDANDAKAGATKKDMEFHRPFRNRTFLIRDGDGETRYILLSGVPVFNEKNGRFAGYRGTGTDVTRHLNAEKSVIEAKSELEHTLGELNSRNQDLVVALQKSEVADNAKIDFLAMMSHELRTPLNCIIGFSDAAIQKVHGEMDESYQEYFINIHKAGGHLLDLINDILDTANIEASNVTIEPVPVRIAELVEDAINMVDPTASGKNTILSESHLGASPDLAVHADRLRARQILVNLLSNAVKFTPKKGKIGVDINPREDGFVDITVWDTGIGIPAQELGRVFDRFYQVEKNILAREAEGTGLGLSISRQLAQLMNGDLTVESTIGKGTRFTLSLPLAPQLS